MPSIKVSIHPTIIDWLMQYISVETKAEIVEHLVNWKNGIKEPTFKQIETMSSNFNIPLGYFFLQSPPDENLPVLQYRTIDSVSTEKPSREVIDTITEMECIQEWMFTYLKNEESDKLSFVGSCNHNMGKYEIADKIRTDLRIEADWYCFANKKNEAFKFLRSKLEQVGILVMMSGIVRGNTHRNLKIEELRAFTLIDDYVPLVFINSNDSDGARLFSLLHEATHIWLGLSNFYNTTEGYHSQISEIEKLCNAVAAEILAPDSHFDKEWNKLSQHNIDNKIQILGNIFNCGATSLARKALERGYIDNSKYVEIADKAKQQFAEYRNSQKEKRGGDFYNNLSVRFDSHFLLTLDNSVREGKTSYTEAFRLTNTNSKTYFTLMEKTRSVNSNE